MSFSRNPVGLVCAVLFSCLPALASHVVTGNGFGFAVVSPETATVSKFYAHPYSFGQPKADDPLSEGVETVNFIKSLGWDDSTAKNPSATYEEDSHVIHARSTAGEGIFFMPFGFERAALVINWEPNSAATIQRLACRMEAASQVSKRRPHLRQ